MWLLAAILFALYSGAADAQVSPNVVIGRGNIGAGSVSIMANISSPGQTIPANFIGISGEVGDFTNGFYQGTSGQWTSNGFTGNAASYISLMNLLGSSGVFRLGGGTSDSVTATPVTSGMAGNLNSFLAGMGGSWTLLYGLNLKAADSTTAATSAGNIATAVGVNNVIFQFGNEPSNEGFTAATYTTAWNSYYSAVSTAVSGVKVAAVDDFINIGFGVIPNVVPGLTPGISGMSLITMHWYSWCQTGQWPIAVPAVMLSSIFSNEYGSNVFTGLNFGAGFLSNQGKYGSVLQRLSESNSICDRGSIGMSDRMAAAAWLVNISIVLANAGWAGIDVHSVWTGGIGVYNPAFILPDNNFTATPVFYGMYLFSKIAGEQIVPSSVGGKGNVQAIAAQRVSGKSNIIVVNNDVSNNVSVKPDQSSAWSVANVLQIKGNGGCGEANPTIGGQSIGESGAWSGAPFSLSVGSAFTLGPCESALISIQ